MNHLLALAPDAFAVYGKAWIEAITGVLNLAIANFGVLALAALAVWQNIRTKLLAEQLDAANKRLDRQSDRINQVALATQMPVKDATINAETATIVEAPHAP
jgi:hypothetical protein